MNRQAFSLLEVMLGLMIIGFMLAVFLMGLRSSRQEVEFSDKHVSVLVCSQKVVEDLIEETWLNPNGFKTLGVENTSPDPTPITKGQSVFFSNLEIGHPAPPAGVGGRTDVIHPGMQPLFHQVDDLQLTVQAQRLAGKNSGRLEADLFRGDVGFAWDNKRGKGRSELSALFFTPQSAKKLTPGSMGTADPHDATYSAILGSSGGNPELLRHLGDVYRLCHGFLTSESFTRTLDKIHDLERKACDLPFPSKELYRCHHQLAGLWYELGRDTLGLLATTEPAFSRFSGGYSPEALGEAFRERGDEYRSILRDYRMIYETFVSSLMQARANFQFLVSPAMAKFKGPRRQYHLTARLIDLYRILTIVPTHPNGLNEYHTFLDQLEQHGVGGNPYLKRFVWQEKQQSGSLDDLVNRLPNLQVLDTLLNFKLGPALGFIRDSLAPPQPQ